MILKKYQQLYGLVDELNDTTTEMIGMKPKDVIKLDQVQLVNQEVYPPEDKLQEDGLYQYLLQPGEEHDDQQHRATDRIWSKKTYRLIEIMEDTGNHVMYYLKDGPGRAFVSEELMLIPEDTELPPDYIQYWQKTLPIGNVFYLSDTCLSKRLHRAVQDRDLCPCANVEIPSFLEIRLSSSLFRATLLTSMVWTSCLVDLNIN